MAVRVDCAAASAGDGGKWSVRLNILLSTFITYVASTPKISQESCSPRSSRLFDHNVNEALASELYLYARSSVSASGV